MLFLTARAFFVIFNLPYDFECPFADFFASCIHGFKLDISATSYILFFLTPFFIASAFIKNQKIFKRFLDIFTAILIIIFSFLIVSDAEIYRSWQFRINKVAISYLENPSLALASTSNVRLAFLIVLALVYSAIMFALYKILTRKCFNRLQDEKFWSLLFIPISAILVIPIRGGLGIVPLNVGSAYFSDNTFVNHAAINVGWNFANSFFQKDTDFSEFHYSDNIDIEYLTQQNKEPDTDILNSKPEHIIFVVLESFTHRAIMPDNPNESLTPKLVSRLDEGIYFKNFYAAGDRSEKGLVAIFSAMPPLPHYSIAKDAEKSNRLPSLIRDLRNDSYATSFYYGGDINFANLKSYLTTAGIESFYTQNNMNLNCRQTKWGYDDECMFDRLFTNIENSNGKTLDILFTLNSHEPFDAPITPFGTDDENTKIKNVYFYTDSCLNIFVEKMKSSPKWEKSLIILVSDHGNMYNLKDYSSPDKSRIIMLWLGGTITKPREFDYDCDQTDIAETLLTLLKIKHLKYPLSDDIFGTKMPNAFSVFTESYSLAENGRYVWYSTAYNKTYCKQNVEEYYKIKNHIYCQKVAEETEKLTKFNQVKDN